MRPLCFVPKDQAKTYILYKKNIDYYEQCKILHNKIRLAGSVLKTDTRVDLSNYIISQADLVPPINRKLCKAKKKWPDVFFWLRYSKKKQPI